MDVREEKRGDVKVADLCGRFEANALHSGRSALNDIKFNRVTENPPQILLQEINYISLGKLWLTDVIYDSIFIMSVSRFLSSMRE